MSEFNEKVAGRIYHKSKENQTPTPDPITRVEILLEKEAVKQVKL